MNHAIVWVKLAKYVELTGDSADAVHGRRRLGKWKDGYHCKIADGHLWVNLSNVEKWVNDGGNGDAPWHWHGEKSSRNH